MKRGTIVAMVVLLAAGGAARADAPGHPQGKVYSGTGLELKTFYAPRSIQGNAEARIGTGQGTVHLTACTVPPNRHVAEPKNGAAQVWPEVSLKCQASLETESLCGGKVGEPATVALVPGVFDATGMYSPAKKGQKMLAATLSCRNGDSRKWADLVNWGSAAKCAQVWHYEPGTAGADPVAARRFAACVRMARADYFGDGTSYTTTGTEVFAYEPGNTGIHNQYKCNAPRAAPVPEDRRAETPAWNECKMWLEASWDEHGAICILHPRWEILPAEVKAAMSARGRYEKKGHVWCRKRAATALLYDRSELNKQGGGVEAIPPDPRAEIDPHCACCDTPDCARPPDTSVTWPPAQ